MATLLVFSFLAGLITILAPCIWPLLPIVFSASSGGGRRRALGLTLGVMTSFTIFTLFISYVIKIFPFDPNSLRLAAVVIIVLLGLSMLLPPLGARFEVLVNHVLGPLQSRFKKEGSGLSAGLVTGFSLGLVWAPCAGPILATVAALSATQAVNARVVAVTLAYVLGLGIPLFIFSSLSAGLFQKMRAVNKYTGRIQQAFGLVMIITAVLIYTNYAQVLQARVLNHFPGYSRFLGRFENDSRLQKQLGLLAGRSKTASESDKKLLSEDGLAPDFAGISHWLNVPARLTMQALRGKVVLIDFWTYSCINCVRTLPHLTAWYKRYKNDGLVIVGVHTPEFAFEHKTQNVANAIKQFGITYPVAQDNDYKTWQAYQNEYWPAEYLIDAQGQIRYVHFGEGHYDRTQEAIRVLLKENGHPVEGPLVSVKDRTPQFERTPETYLGRRRMERFVSPEKIVAGDYVYSLPAEIPLNHFAYQGTWDVEPQWAKAGPGAALEFKVKAGKVFLVAGPVHAGDRIKVFVDGKPAADIILDTQRLYKVVGFPGVEVHTLRLEFPDAGTKVYAFTFG
ncbi:MAG: cytochrome c biogenesis protein DipZ [Candidatus Omnitrophica bacterium]|nr:cytochrome c biogenesis protein DipZ [Candidatus Omnitrophota bacterium]MDE2009209.1 cytochrome c biogenesis protein DipZ [Candidatus Omnitrophota bacterium]MDE2213730.1 cytochrome c biogenesis protein DipZ [Candidatus Omnitrophota bacterium]MDE2230695.1 cytochrome c biogenesis protein DipZ [Candidatus Omnitrophota bacterium]